jgi:uncharacterized protein YggE
MMRPFSLALCAAVSISSAVFGQVPSAASAREPEVIASGTAELHTPPTFANLTVAITTSAATAAQAASQNAAKTAATITALRQAGIAAEDIATQGYSIEQAYDNRGRHTGEFTARNALQIHIGRIDRVGTVIDAAVSAGATDISGIQYGSAIMDDVRRNAMAEAVRRARADAALIASAAGGTLGRLISITSSAGTPPGYGRLMGDVALTAMMSPSSPTNVIAPRDLNAVASASGRWEFVPGH